MLGLCVLAEAAMLGIGIDDLDEGYFAQQASRVLHGQVPFRDFATLYSPGLLAVHAALWSLFGGPALGPLDRLLEGRRGQRRFVGPKAWLAVLKGK